jgi:hypothetical protein
VVASPHPGPFQKVAEMSLRPLAPGGVYTPVREQGTAVLDVTSCVEVTEAGQTHLSDRPTSPISFSWRERRTESDFVGLAVRGGTHAGRRADHDLADVLPR